jgi:predicted dienelactone hydrolase
MKNAWVLSQDAELRLRGGVRVRVTWPPTTHAEPPVLLVFVQPPADGALVGELAVRVPAVVLAVEQGSPAEALEWGADHAAELGADPGHLILAGDHAGAGTVAALARQARDRGWPPIDHLVLIDRTTRVDALARMLQVASSAIHSP